MSKRLRIALIGNGAVSRIFYIPLLRESSVFELAYLVDTDERTFEGLPNVSVFAGGFQDFFENHCDFDAVICALPHSLHVDCVVAALERGFDVLCEKPLSLESAGVSRVEAAAHGCGRLVRVCQPRRALGAANLIEELRAIGWLGALKRVRWLEGQPYGWPAGSIRQLLREYGGEEVFDIGAHVFDLLTKWLGSLELTLYVDDGVGGTAGDFSLAFLNGDGVDVRVHLSRVRQTDNRACLEFEHGTLWWDLERPDTVTVVTPTTTFDARHGEQSNFGDAMRAQLDDFARGIRERRVGIVPPQALLVSQIFDQIGAHRARSRPFQISTNVPRRVVVTGASGFIGERVVARMCAEGFSVRAVARTPMKCARLVRHPAEVMIADLRQVDDTRRALEEVETIIHCAGSAACPPDEAAEINKNVIALAASRRLVLMGSMMRFGDPPVDGVVTEESPFKGPSTPYAEVKQAMVRIAREAQSRHGGSIVVLHPTCVYGPGAPDFVDGPAAAMRASNFVHYDGSGEANLVHVEDVAAAALAAMNDRGFAEYLVNAEEDRRPWIDFFRDLAACIGASSDDFLVATDEQLCAERARIARAGRFPGVLVEALRRDYSSRLWVSRHPIYRALKRLRRHGARGEPAVTAATAATAASALPNARALPENYAKYFDDSAAAFFRSRAVYSSRLLRSRLGWAPLVRYEDALPAIGAALRPLSLEDAFV